MAVTNKDQSEDVSQDLILRVAAIPISVASTDGEEVLIVPGDALKLAFWLDRYDNISRRPGLSACIAHPDNSNLVGNTQLLAKDIYRRELSLRERFENPSCILPSLQEDARWDLGLI